MNHGLLLVLCWLCCSAGTLSGQAWIIVDDITVTGQKRTREAVIRREIPFAPGDTVALIDLADLVVQGERQLMNTGLFNSAEITYANWEGSTQRVSLLVEVMETWYFYPVPIFELADRNFNVWWNEQGRSLERVNVGLEFSHYNFTGWRDKFAAEFKYGYTRSFGLEYRLPYINAAGTLGYAGLISFARNREVNYATEDNKQLFFSDPDRFLIQRFRVESELSWRPELYAQHSLGIGFFQNRVDPLIASELNPNYLGDGRTLQRYFRLAYSYSYDFRDVRAYPWEGFLVGGTLERIGLGFFGDRNALTIRLVGEKYWPLGNRWSFALLGRTKLSLLRQEQPYNDNRGLGFGQDRLRGYEYYIVDGLDMVAIQTSLRYELWNGTIDFGAWIPLEAFRFLPFRLNLSLNNDWGIAHDPYNTFDNPLNDRGLWGGGLGLDFIFYYDFVFSLQYSRNILGEGGLFLHFDAGL